MCSNSPRPIRSASARAVKHSTAAGVQAELGGMTRPSPARPLVFAALKAPLSASKRPAGANGLIQKKKKRDKYRAAEQDKPVPYIKTDSGVRC
jgi:hypothetical protein